MLSLKNLADAFDQGRKQFHNLMSSRDSWEYEVKEHYDGGHDNAKPVNRLVKSDNLTYMKYLIKEKKMAGKIKLIYLDPPFFSNAKYQSSVQLQSDKVGKSRLYKVPAYDDRWSDGLAEYLTMLTVRLMLMKELLSDKGSIWVHLDWHGVHYVKIIMDQVFGEKNFINEVIWTYKSGGSNKKSFSRKHDNLLLYSKSSKYDFNLLREKSYNRELKPYRFKGVKEYEDEKGWYTVVNMKDVWSIDMVGRTSKERTGYATQKPEKLIGRILEASSNEGDICADFFSGSGTFGCVCSRMNRQWIMCDSGGPAISDAVWRLSGQEGCFEVSFNGKGTEPWFGVGSLSWKLDKDLMVLQEYKLNEQYIPVKEAEEMTGYLEKDSLSLIKLWSIDMNYDGQVHRPDIILTKGQRSAICSGKKGSARIHVAGYDVFGNRFEGSEE
ncbi:MAG: site-specific DNA-methyltransferase [Clostridiales bacterium]|nr:site-specific DNA-methyltransferase [Clostridiales bacterium]